MNLNLGQTLLICDLLQAARRRAVVAFETGKSADPTSAEASSRLLRR